jgi:hypothetical protein
MTIELVPLCDAVMTLREPVMIADSPLGTRMIFEVASATVTGDRLQATLRNEAASADWVTVGPNGVCTLDVRLTLETHDGAVILSTYRGRTTIASGIVYSAPIYDTGDDRYQWLNAIQAVAKGTLDGNLLTYEIYEVR